MGNGMAEKYLKCPSCGAGNPDGKKFCGDCGAMLPQPPPPPQVEPVPPTSIQPKQTWIASNWRTLAVVAVVAVIVLAVVGLAYTQPWSKIKVIVSNGKNFRVYFAIYFDGKEKGRGSIDPNQEQIFGVWSVAPGAHLVAMDSHFLGTMGPQLDGKMEFSYEYSVGPLYTKNVYAVVTATAPDLVGDLTLFYDDSNNEVRVTGPIFNYGPVACYGSLHVNIWDSRGWSMTDTIHLGAVNASSSVGVDRTYDWPNYYNGQYSYGKIPDWDYSLTYT